MSAHILTLAVAILIAAGAGAAEVRTWTAASGKTVEASLSEDKGSTVHLLTTEGKRIAIALSRLSEDDQIYVKYARRMRKWEKPEAAEELAQLGSSGEWVDFLHWDRAKRLENGECVYFVLFPSEAHRKAFLNRPLDGVNIKMLKANKITLAKEGKAQWFVCGSRAAIEQEKENLYESRLYSEDYESVNLFFKKDAFDSIKQVPENRMGNAYGPYLCYVYGKVVKNRYREVISVGGAVKPAEEPPRQ